MQEMRDGAIDGLSAADLEAAGEQIRKLSSYVFKAIENLRSSAAKVPPHPPINSFLPQTRPFQCTESLGAGRHYGCCLQIMNA